MKRSLALEYIVAPILAATSFFVPNAANAQPAPADANKPATSPPTDYKSRNTESPSEFGFGFLTGVTDGKYPGYGFRLSGDVRLPKLINDSLGLSASADTLFGTDDKHQFPAFTDLKAGLSIKLNNDVSIKPMFSFLTGNDTGLNAPFFARSKTQFGFAIEDAEQSKWYAQFLTNGSKLSSLDAGFRQELVDNVFALYGNTALHTDFSKAIDWSARVGFDWTLLPTEATKNGNAYRFSSFSLTSGIETRLLAQDSFFPSYMLQGQVGLTWRPLIDFPEFTVGADLRAVKYFADKETGQMYFGINIGFAFGGEKYAQRRKWLLLPTGGRSPLARGDEGDGHGGDFFEQVE